MNKELHNQAWAVAKEYARLTGAIIGAEETEWIGAETRNGEIVGEIDVCIFNDYIAMTLDEMMTIVDDISKWRDRYGDNIAVGRVVREWYDYLTDRDHEEAILQRIGLHKVMVHRYISLATWLRGFRPDSNKDFQELSKLGRQLKALNELTAEYPTASLCNCMQQVRAREKELIGRVKAQIRELKGGEDGC